MSTLLTALHAIAEHFDPNAAADESIVFAFYVANEAPCYIAVDNKTLRIEEGTHTQPSITFFTDMHAVLRVASGQADLDQTFKRLFPVPEVEIANYAPSQHATILS